jgi:hypothetical protein
MLGILLGSGGFDGGSYDQVGTLKEQFPTGLAA